MADHRIYMSFFVRGPFEGSKTGKAVWVCGFLEEDAKTVIGRSRLFEDVAKVRQLIDRTATLQDDAFLNHYRDGLLPQLKLGRGGVWLTLTETQYRKLKGLAPERRVVLEE